MHPSNKKTYARLAIGWGLAGVGYVISTRIAKKKAEAKALRQEIKVLKAVNKAEQEYRDRQQLLDRRFDNIVRKDFSDPDWHLKLD